MAVVIILITSFILVRFILSDLANAQFLNLQMKESHIGTYGLSCCTVYPEQYKTNDPGADLLGNDNNSLADSLYYF